jgi:hypothetical protein
VTVLHNHYVRQGLNRIVVDDDDEDDDDKLAGPFTSWTLSITQAAMSDYTSSPSRPASPVGPLPDLPTARPSAYRFNWDPASRRPGPASVSETTEGRGDHFTTTPKVDIYGAQHHPHQRTPKRPAVAVE